MEHTVELKLFLMQLLVVFHPSKDMAEYPSTRTFQALRIAVNNELESLDSLLEKAPNWLLEGGLFMVMSFHSLEDRRVKSSFKTDNRLKVLSKKPIKASPQEIELNPRSTSAKLRISTKKFLK